MQYSHIIRKTTDPVSAPPEAGIHWINTVLNKEYFSVGTSTVADWILREASSSPSTYEHTQSSASTTWTINHNLGFFPSVMARSTGGLVVDCEIQHVNNNQVILTFTIALEGFASCT